ncbi:MAG: glycosyltransferase family 4 protein [Nitrospirae bacterium]|nr:glycosyltransferase family 4 protein [Nitrospirota bacterium]
MLAMMTKANPRMVYDFDDAVMFHELERGEAMTGKHFTRFCRIAAACRGVVAGNGYLAEFAVAAREKGAGWQDVITLPTPVDTDAIRPKEYNASDRVVVGWMGTKGNLPHLTAILPAIRAAFAGHPGAMLRVVSDADPGITGVPCNFKAWDAGSEADDLAGFDIGVMPLADDIWTRGKGGYKLLQYMASGVPAIASPVGINQDIIRHGENGLIADDMHGWTDALGRLMCDAALRERLGRAGRETVEKDYSLGEYNRKLLGFLERFL